MAQLEKSQRQPKKKKSKVAKNKYKNKKNQRQPKKKQSKVAKKKKNEPTRLNKARVISWPSKSSGTQKSLDYFTRASSFGSTC